LSLRSAAGAHLILICMHDRRQGGQWTLIMKLLARLGR